MAAVPLIHEQNELAALMEKLGVGQQFLSDYSGVSQSEISKIINGLRLGSDSRDKVVKALNEFEWLQNIFGTVQLAFRDVQTTRHLIEEFRKQPEVKNDIATNMDRIRGFLAAGDK